MQRNPDFGRSHLRQRLRAVLAVAIELLADMAWRG
jgi:hypothetical protein